MKKIGVYLDCSNLYFCILKKYNKKLDYAKYIDYVKDLGPIEIARVYGAQVKGEAQNFIHCLNKLGFETFFKTPKVFNDPYKRKASCDLEIALDIMDNIDAVDMVILGSSDSDFLPLIERLVARGKDVVILSCGISKDLKMAQCIEIPESLCEG